MQHIETIELASSQSSITFSSIPQDYDDLVVLVSVRTLGSFPSVFGNFTLNSNTTNRSLIELRGDGSNVSTSSQTFFRTLMTGDSATSSTFGNGQIYISNYSRTNIGKSISVDNVTENNGTTAEQQIFAGLWDVNSAVTEITVAAAGSGDFVADSSFSLYGITAGGDGTVTTS